MNEYNPRITTLTKQQWELMLELENSIDKDFPGNPVALNSIDQPLVDNLCAIIRELFSNIDALQK